MEFVGADVKRQSLLKMQIKAEVPVGADKVRRKEETGRLSDTTGAAE